MEVFYTWEHNGADSLVWLDDFPGAYVRGDSLEAALAKVPEELRAYLRWRDGAVPDEPFSLQMRQDRGTGLAVSDADSDALLSGEALPLTEPEYEGLKQLALRSAECFQRLYDSIPDKSALLSQRRQTFYGQRPSTAEEMYRHTKNVNAYYFDQLGVDAGNEPDILTCRQEGFQLLERLSGFLCIGAVEGDYDELWSLRKLCRRFLWHDRIHAKAMYRHAIQRFPRIKIDNSFSF